ncbi:hypothetical protein [Limnoglobus roseus]|uniref:DNA-binding protein n=1 Tax=Limnoglobus roseus TaxID=2598579 RepID=A0A5C1A8E8_9BACT|nr:hypothetical protein [Limnoglobus roseus]QEL14042.1 hypothetical protein PX52LOC_00905 [Limnoglobus roseus]
MSNEPQPKYLKPSQAAAHCSVSSRMINHWIRKGVRIEGRLIKLRAVAFGDRFRVTMEDLEFFRDECTRAKLGEPEWPPPETDSEVERRFRRENEELQRMLAEW